MDIILHVGHPKTGSDFIQLNYLNSSKKKFIESKKNISIFKNEIYKI